MSQKEINCNDLRVQKTRKALVEAFYELSETRWIEDITIGDLCEKAMIRRATFYKHFNDRFDFFEYAMNSVQVDVNAEMNAHPKNVTLAEYCYNICIGWLRNFHMHPKMVKKLNASDSRQQYLDVLNTLLTNSVKKKIEYDKQNGIDLSINAEVLAGFIAGAIPVVVSMFEMGKMSSISEEEFLDSMKKIFRNLCGES